MIIVSKTDIAGMNIAKILKEEHNIDVHYIEKRQIYVRELPEAEYYLFASRHSSELGQTSLTVHTTGNFTDDNQYGGNPKELSYCNPFMMRNALKILNEKNNTDVPVVMEATHHGPTSLSSPVIYIEVGSKEKDWQNLTYCKIVADTIAELIKTKHSGKKSYIYFGGSHYNKEVTKLMLKEYAIGHICAKYASEYMNEEIIKQMITKTMNCKTAIIDWKLKSEHKNNIVRILDKLNFKWVKRKELKD